MMWLPDGEKILDTVLLISTDYTNVMDGQKYQWMDTV